MFCRRSVFVWCFFFPRPRCNMNGCWNCTHTIVAFFKVNMLCQAYMKRYYKPFSFWSHENGWISKKISATFARPLHNLWFSGDFLGLEYKSMLEIIVLFNYFAFLLSLCLPPFSPIWIWLSYVRQLYLIFCIFCFLFPSFLV